MLLLYKILEESPSRCIDYKNITESNGKELLVLFVTHEWVENELVA